MSGYRADDEWSNTNMYGEPVGSGWKLLAFVLTAVALASVVGYFGRITFWQVSVALFALFFTALAVSFVVQLRRALSRGYFDPMRGNPYRTYRSSSSVWFWTYFTFIVFLVPACAAFALFLALLLYVGLR